MKRIATRPPTGSCKKVHAALIQTEINVSSVTVSCLLSFAFDLKSFKLSRKWRLTAAMKCRSLAFAKQQRYTER